MTPMKKEETTKEVDIQDSEAVDRISALPSNLIHCILKHLPTRCAVATSLLKKRWRYAWIGVPILDFTNLPSTISDTTTFNKEQCACYKNFVNRVLLLNSTPCLEHIRLVSYDGLAPTYAFEWNIVLARRCCEELYLTNNVFCIVSLPPFFLLDREKLVVLKLEGSLELQLPSSVHFPRLVIFSLKQVVFDEVHDPFATLLSSCPMLKELNIDGCQGLEKYTIQSSSLRTLRIVSFNKKKQAVIIKTPNLEQLELSVGIKQSTVTDLSSLVAARLDIWTSTVRWAKLLQKFHHIKTLILYRITLDGSNYVNQLPTFLNLTQLEVAFSPWPIAIQVLRNAPSLVSFIIHKLMFDWPDTVPESNAVPLERIVCHCFDEVGESLEIMRYFLSNTKLLKELKIYVRSCLNSESENEILKMLLKLHRASSQCQITIVNGDDNLTSEESDSESEESESD